jgi:hypothetical protein
MGLDGLLGGTMADHSDKATEERRQRNRDILAPLSDSGANGRFFAERAQQRGEIVRKLNVALRQIKTEQEHEKTEEELLQDDWQFHRGPADTPEKKSRMNADINARRLQQRVLEKRLQQRAAYQGSLMDGFEDGEFGELPSDSELADALCKANPELKKYRKDLI